MHIIHCESYMRAGIHSQKAAGQKMTYKIKYECADGNQTDVFDGSLTEAVAEAIDLVTAGCDDPNTSTMNWDITGESGYEVASGCGNNCYIEPDGSDPSGRH